MEVICRSVFEHTSPPALNAENLDCEFSSSLDYHFVLAGLHANELVLHLVPLDLQECEQRRPQSEDDEDRQDDLVLLEHVHDFLLC